MTLTIASIAVEWMPDGLGHWGGTGCRVHCDACSGRREGTWVEMDGTRFDELAKAVAGSSRRALLKGGLGAALGVVLGGFAPDDASAAVLRRIGEVCRKHGDCASGFCGAADRAGRRRCGCDSELDCPAPSGPCRAAVCVEGACGTTITTGAPCPSAENLCIVGVCQADGSCADPKPVVCDDNNVCTRDTCDPNTGQCVFTPIACDDNNACTVDTCDPVRGCVNTPVSCDDGDPCTTDVCDSKTGACMHLPKFNLTQLDNDDKCHAHTCDPQTGNLIKTPIVICNDNNVCTDDTCDPATGQCVYTPNDSCDG